MIFDRSATLTTRIQKKDAFSYVGAYNTIDEFFSYTGTKSVTRISDGCMEKTHRLFNRPLCIYRTLNKYILEASSSSYIHKYIYMYYTWVRVRVQFALIKAVDLRTRGSRKRWRSSGFEDGEGIATLFQRWWGVLYSCLDSMFCIDFRVLGFHV